MVLTAKRRNIAGNATVLVNDGHGLSVVTTSAAAAAAHHHHHGPEATGVDGVGPAVAQLLQTGNCWLCIRRLGRQMPNVSIMYRQNNI